ncbi:hypothetical protein OKW23_000372 [Bacilli bacterium PM5-9]|nr:hypothetical protein [Bacilli bacterium PM5-9]
MEVSKIKTIKKVFLLLLIAFISACSFKNTSESVLIANSENLDENNVNLLYNSILFAKYETKNFEQVKNEVQIKIMHYRDGKVVNIEDLLLKEKGINALDLNVLFSITENENELIKNTFFLEDGALALNTFKFKYKKNTEFDEYTNRITDEDKLNIKPGFYILNSLYISKDIMVLKTKSDLKKPKEVIALVLEVK